MMAIFKKNSVLLAIAVTFGILTGYLNDPISITIATSVSDIFINLLKLVSLPIIFLSIVSIASGMENADEMQFMGKKVIKYTIFTTLLASTIALFIFLIINPAGGFEALGDLDTKTLTGKGYLKYFINIVPSNIIEPFFKNNVIGVLFLAILLSFAVISLPNENRNVLHNFFKSLFAAIMKVTAWIVRIMPIAIWAFITLFIRDLGEGLKWQPIAGYLACVILANLVQAGIVLPLLLRSKGLSTRRIFRGMLPALSVAFFSKSSSAALPMAVKCAETRLGVPSKIAGFSLPLCITINMNACAAFILITSLFVATSHGMVFSPAEYGIWILIATIAAIGNAGVPMGCFFLSSAILAAMNVPLQILGVILPFYSLIDMLESAINVWSDSCVTMVVNKELAEKPVTQIQVS